MSKLIIVEGPQGVGKTTVTNWLREQIPYSNLYRMTGHNARGGSGLEMSDTMYKALMNYTNQISSSGVNMIFDRTFITEQVYCDLGYKDYNFLPVFTAMIRELDDCGFDVHIIHLYLDDIVVYEDRLVRDKPQFHNVKFNLANSIMQQRMYSDVMVDIKRRSSRISIHHVSTDTVDQWKNELRSIFHDVLAKPKLNGKSLSAIPKTER